MTELSTVSKLYYFQIQAVANSKVHAFVLAADFG